MNMTILLKLISRIISFLRYGVISKLCPAMVAILDFNTKYKHFVLGHPRNIQVMAHHTCKIGRLDSSL
jgi:hypothetical protein